MKKTIFEEMGKHEETDSQTIRNDERQEKQI